MAQNLSSHPKGPAPANETRRQRILSELERGTFTARDLSKLLRISEKEVVAHMEHVSRSLKLPKRLIVDPSICHRCGFTFSDRRRFSSPGRCPKCRHEGIQPPSFRVES